MAFPKTNPLLSTITILLLLTLFSSKANAAADNETDFTFPSFDSSSRSRLIFQRDATISSKNTLQLTKTNAKGNPLPNSVGRVVYSSPVHIWDDSLGYTQISSFETTFTIVIESPTREIRGDGITFFIAPVNSQIPPDSDGGFFGLFTNNTVDRENATYQTLAVEFDTYIDGRWDPGYSVYRHIGIDVNTVRSRATIPWYHQVGKELTVNLRYTPNNQILYVEASYPDSDVPYQVSSFLYLPKLFPKRVWVGFSAATGDSAVQNHIVKNWTFSAWLHNVSSLTTNMGENIQIKDAPLYYSA